MSKKMRWLFRFNAGEQYGMGHFMRCLTLAKTFQKEYRGDILFVINNDPIVIHYLRMEKIPIAISDEGENIINKFSPSVIIIDINNLNRKNVECYRDKAPVVNLAPRGISKYYADATFIPLEILDIPCPSNASEFYHFKGPKYTIVSPKFVALRNNILQVPQRWNPNKLVISMGGSDQINMTKLALQSLEHITHDLEIKVILGPLNSHENKIRKLAKSLDYKIQVIKNPPDIAMEIIENYLGLFGMGITTYEALCIGVPSINIGPDSYHRFPGEDLSVRGVIDYLGCVSNIEAKELGKRVSKLIDKPIKIKEMRESGMNLIDGQGQNRVVEKIVEKFE